MCIVRRIISLSRRHRLPHDLYSVLMFMILIFSVFVVKAHKSPISTIFDRVACVFVQLAYHERESPPETLGLF